MGTRPPTRRVRARARAIDQALALVATARTDRGDGQLLLHVTTAYGELARPGDPTGTAARHGRLLASLAFVAASALERWAEFDPQASEAFLATLASHGGD